MIPDAFSYPWRNGGWIVILIGSLFACLFDLLQFVPLAGIGIGIFASGYFGSFYLLIVGSTMTGSDKLPDWPGFTSMLDDIISPFLLLMFLVLVSFLPLIAALFLLAHASPWFLPAVVTSVFYGVLYFPMAVAGASAFGGPQGGLPHIVFPAIFRCIPGYFLSVATLCLAVFVGLVVEVLGRKIPCAGLFAASAISLYSMMVQGRMIGLIYREKRDVLNWEE